MTWIQGIQIDYAEANICIREPNPDAENGSFMHNARYGFVCRKKREREQGEKCEEAQNKSRFTESRFSNFKTTDKPNPGTLKSYRG